MDWNGINRQCEEDNREREEDLRRMRQLEHLRRIQEMASLQQRLTQLHQVERAAQQELERQWRERRARELELQCQ
jgi:hypothetical protein